MINLCSVVREYIYMYFTISQYLHYFIVCCVGGSKDFTIAHTALGFASCCMTFSTTPLVLYLPYSTMSHAITYMYVYN